MKTKQLLRTKVRFPGIDQAAESMITHCIPCQAVTPQNKQETLVMSTLPAGRWQNVTVDFIGPHPECKTLVVVIDEDF